MTMDACFFLSQCSVVISYCQDHGAVALLKDEAYQELE